MLRPLSLVAVVVLLVGAGSSAQPAPYDLLVRNGRIVDGTGNPWYRADVAIADDTVVAIAPSLAGPATRVIDAEDRVVSPGFIDIHTHARRGLFLVPTADNYVRQGVTTIFEGQDGSSPLPLGAFLERVAETPMTPNFASFIGQGSVRGRVVGRDDRAATPNEIVQMAALVRQGMLDGAFGLSSGLFYVPGAFASTEEVITLAAVAGDMGGIYISHMRDEAAGLLDSVRETIRIGEEGGLPTQLTHHKAIGEPNWGRSSATLRLVDEARVRGVDTTIDQYPYTASSTSVQAALFPKWAQEGDRPAVLGRLRDTTMRGRIRGEIATIIRDERGGGDASGVQLASCEWDRSLDGKTLADVTEARGVEATLENAAETAIWIVEQGGCQGIFHAIDEEDLVRIMRHPATMVASDGGIQVFGQASPHPRSYGTFARVLGRYVREQGVLTLEDAVRKMSALPAQRTGLVDRGVLRPGMKADIVVFDPDTIVDRATFEAPHQYAEGVAYVIINGRVAFEEGAMTDARPGRVLYGPAVEGR